MAENHHVNSDGSKKIQYPPHHALPGNRAHWSKKEAVSKLFKTSNMEEAALLLAAYYDHVVIRNSYVVKNPIRFRHDLIDPAHPYILRADKAFNSQREEWQKNGGILLSYRTDEGLQQPCDAMLLTECPLSVYELKMTARNVKNVVVVYQPPTWKGHEDEAYFRTPSIDTCENVMKAITSKTNGAGAHEKAVARVLGIPLDGLSCVTDEILSEETDLHVKALAYARDAAIGKKYYRIVMQLIPRIDPEPKELKCMYDHIVNECPSVGGYKIAINLGKAARFWKSNIRALVRCGSIEKKETLGFYFPDEFNPDYRAIELRHKTSRVQLDRMKELIENAPELTSRNVKSRARQKVQPQSQPSVSS